MVVPIDQCPAPVRCLQRWPQGGGTLHVYAESACPKDVDNIDAEESSGRLQVLHEVLHVSDPTWDTTWGNAATTRLAALRQAPFVAYGPPR